MVVFKNVNKTAIVAYCDDCSSLKECRNLAEQAEEWVGPALK